MMFIEHVEYESGRLQLDNLLLLLRYLRWSTVDHNANSTMTADIRFVAFLLTAKLVSN